jgi:hypothetical protein
LLTSPFASQHRYFYNLVRKHGLRVLNITRKNYLRSLLSEFKATASGKWWWIASEKNHYCDQRITIDVPHLLECLKACETEDELAQSHFSTYRKKYLACDYVDVFCHNSRGVTGEFLERFSGWLSIP